MTAPHASDTVWLFDVDNTLLDNDRVIADLRSELDARFGPGSAGRYWVHFEAIRDERGYADYLGALQRFRADVADDPGLYELSAFLLGYPFADRVYPGAREALAAAGALGPTVLLSDGDVVFQPRKVRRSGLWEAVDGRVVIYVHKEETLDDLQRRHPARHYVMVDDKLRILTAMKAVLGGRLTTVFVRQGHYANDRAAIAGLPDADRTIERIDDFPSLQWA